MDLNKARKDIVSELDGIVFDNGQYYADKKLIKNIFNIKTDKKLKELLKVSGLEYPDQYIEKNKFAAKDLKMIADFAGGKKSEQLNDLANKIIQYKFSESKMQEDFDHMRDEYENDLFTYKNDEESKEFWSCFGIKNPWESSQHGYSFEIPKVGMLNYQGKYNGEKYCLNTMRYYYYSAQNVLSNASVLSTAREFSNDVSKTFYQELGNMIYDAYLNEEEKEQMFKTPHDLLIKKILDCVKKNVIQMICDNDGIDEEQLDVRFTKQILNNAMLLAAVDIKLFKALYKSFCIVQYHYIMGKYNYNR